MYVVIGAGGFLGNYLIRAILELTKENVLAVSRSSSDRRINARVEQARCDVTHREDIYSLYERVRYEKIKVLYLAAMHHPDEILTSPLRAWNANIAALADFLGIFESMDAFYYTSTEVVYGETGGIPVDESAPLHPISRYGELKALAEQIVIAAGHHVVRYPVLMGPSLVAGKKHFYDEIVDAASCGRHMEMFHDQKRSMLDFRTASELTVRLMECPEARRYNVVNVSSDEVLSKYDMAVRIAEAHGLDSSGFVAVTMGSSPVFKEKRASETILDNNLIKNILQLPNITMRFE